jgi:hypothetical protein
MWSRLKRRRFREKRYTRLFLRIRCRIHEKYQFWNSRPRVTFLFYYCLFDMEWPNGKTPHSTWLPEFWTLRPRCYGNFLSLPTVWRSFLTSLSFQIPRSPCRPTHPIHSWPGSNNHRRLPRLCQWCNSTFPDPPNKRHNACLQLSLRTIYIFFFKFYLFIFNV